MSDSRDNVQQPEDNIENETSRLHRLVLPMILDLLRSRAGLSRNRRSRAVMPNTNLGGAQPLSRAAPPTAQDNQSAETDQEDAHTEDMLIDPIAQPDSNDEASSNNQPDNHESDAMQTDETLPSATAPATTTPSSPRRPRYRLVVYFEERELQEDSASAATDGDDAPRDTPNRPSRYVAIFSVDSDDQNMPIIHSAGLQNTPANFDDILNQLFNSYVPKGTPPAKQDIIDSLPTSTYSAVRKQVLHHAH